MPAKKDKIELESNDLQKQYDLIYENINGKLSQQIESLGSIDTKASILLATIGIIIAGYFQLLSCDGLVFKDYRLIIAAEIILLILSGFFAFKAFILHDNEYWRNDPKPSKLIETFAQNYKKGYYWLKSEITRWMATANDKNIILIEAKYKMIRFSKNLLFLAISLIAVHLLLSLYCVEKIVIQLKY